MILFQNHLVNTLRPRQNGRHLPDDIFKSIFLNEKFGISIKISLKFVPKGPINNIPAWVQMMAWHWPGVKPLSEPMMVRLPMHLCVTLPQWVKICIIWKNGQYVPFKLHFPSNENYCILINISLKLFLRMQLAIIIPGSGNGLVPNRWQVIHHLN